MSENKDIKSEVRPEDARKKYPLDKADLIERAWIEARGLKDCVFQSRLLSAVLSERTASLRQEEIRKLEEITSILRNDGDPKTFIKTADDMWQAIQAHIRELGGGR